MSGLSLGFGAGLLSVLWGLRLQEGPGVHTCTESEEGEQERCPGHGGDALELCFLRPYSTAGLPQGLLFSSVLWGYDHLVFMQMSSSSEAPNGGAKEIILST